MNRTGAILQWDIDRELILSQDCVLKNKQFSASKSKIVIFLLGSAAADASPLLRVESMWYKIDFSAILGGFIGLVIMLVVIALFSSPLTIERLLSILLP